MNKRWTKLLSVVCLVAMLVGLLPMAVLPAAAAFTKNKYEVCLIDIATETKADADGFFTLDFNAAKSKSFSSGCEADGCVHSKTGENKGTQIGSCASEGVVTFTPPKAGTVTYWARINGSTAVNSDKMVQKKGASDSAYSDVTVTIDGGKSSVDSTSLTKCTFEVEKDVTYKIAKASKGGAEFQVAHIIWEAKITPPQEGEIALTFEVDDGLTVTDLKVGEESKTFDSPINVTKNSQVSFKVAADEHYSVKAVTFKEGSVQEDGGTYTITSVGEENATVKITATADLNPATEITMAEDPITITLDNYNTEKTQALEIKTVAQDPGKECTDELKVSSTNEAVASWAGGQITAKAIGVTTIEAKAGSATAKKCVVSVVGPDQEGPYTFNASYMGVGAVPAEAVTYDSFFTLTANNTDTKVTTAAKTIDGTAFQNYLEFGKLAELTFKTENTSTVELWWKQNKAGGTRDLALDDVKASTLTGENLVDNEGKPASSVDNGGFYHGTFTNVEAGSHTIKVAPTNDGGEYLYQIKVTEGAAKPAEKTSLAEKTVTISGMSGEAPVVGDKLTATVSDKVDATQLDFTWTVGSAAVENNKTATYTVKAADVGKTIKVKAAAKEDSTDYEGTTQESEATKEVVKKTVSLTVELEHDEVTSAGGEVFVKVKDLPEGVTANKDFIKVSPSDGVTVEANTGDSVHEDYPVKVKLPANTSDSEDKTYNITAEIPATVEGYTGTSAAVTAKVLKKGAATIKVTDRADTDTTVKVGATLTLSLDAVVQKDGADDTAAELTFAWKHGEDALTAGDRVTIGSEKLTEKDHSGHTKSTLTITNVTAADAGEYTCEITATGATKNTHTFNVTVKPAVSTVTISKAPEGNKMTAGKDFTFAATVNPADAAYKGVYWVSSDANTLTIDNASSGAATAKVTAKAAGKATITAYAVEYDTWTVGTAIPEGTKSASVEITVEPAAVTPTTYAITIADVTGATVTTTPASPVAAGTEVTVNVTVTDPTKELDKITVTDADKGNVTVTNGKFTMPAKAVTVTVTLKAKEGQGGGDEPDEPKAGTVKDGTSASLTFDVLISGEKPTIEKAAIYGPLDDVHKSDTFGAAVDGGIFTIYTKTDGAARFDSADKTFPDGATFNMALNTQGSTTFDQTSGQLSSAILFTVDGAATVKVWARSGGSDERQVQIGTIDFEGKTFNVLDSKGVPSDPSVVEFKLDQAGTYALGNGSSTRIYKVQVSVGEQPIEPTKNPPVLTLGGTTATVEVGKSTTVTAIATNGGTITATSADAETATAEYKDGVVTITGVKEGSTNVTVTATNADGEDEKTIAVTVTKAGGGDKPGPVETTIKITTSKVTIKKPPVAVPLDYDLQIEKGTEYSLYWVSADTTILDVTADGQATGLKAGTALVSVYVLKDLAAGLTDNDNILASDARNIKVATASTTTGNAGSTTGQTTTPAKTTTTTNDNGDTVKTETKTNGDKIVTVTDENGEVVAKVEIPASAPDLSYKFVDVPDEHWAAKAINEVAALGIVQGVSADEHVFDMNSAITRAAMAQILFNLSQGKSGKENTFADAADGWYTDAIAWAASAGVVTGYSADTFGPDDSITRQQLVTMLYRYAKLLDLDVSAKGDLTAYVDGDAVDSWAAEAMAWAVGAGLIQGKGHNDLDPDAAASRAETAVVMDRFLALVK